jgi:predicted pyridoxine 5'-phosphate oxidase superfamily flavin-nucleotide-binding protein
MSAVYHAGQLEVQARAGVRQEASRLGRIVRPSLPPVAQDFLLEQRLVVVGSVEPGGRVWASALAGPAGFARAEDDRTVRVRATPAPGDPLAANVAATGVVGMLAIEFETRRRMRLNGRGRLEADGSLLVRTEQVFANCPKYIQARAVLGPEDAAGDRAPGAAAPVRGRELSAAQRAWIEAADTFFVASARPDGGADASHRGGRPGFVRVRTASRLVWPDYQGNNMFLTLGNIEASPHAGLLFLDFDGGRTLQLTGRARIDWDERRAAAFPGAARLVEFEVDEVIESAPAVRLTWGFLGYSPYNPE